ncbi:helix-turn-helix domain-containing protein [Niabella pedocola]|uniref:Helix-turn-helix domain-containing protein n=1 Tax=Niabella pedocola TaxID=1752077 RepID=A0ABS8PTQ3_9BACT|nr:helix-turn-helix domain-containing protein [Niabella pedocola]MCD2424240.1 helix-turn-helix domain-containing protein [Niabella pedocola]
MNYQTFSPGENVDGFIKCYWTLESTEASAQRQRIVPDGCMEMIFHYGDRYKQYTDQSHCIVQPRCFVIGQLTRPLEIEPTGATGIFAVRFRPEGFIPFATLPVKEMENKAVSTRLLFAAAGSRLNRNILRAGTTAERIAITETFLQTRLEDQRTIDRIAKQTVEMILSANGRCAVDELSGQLQVNRRQLERTFATMIGLSPKQLSRIVRMQTVLRLLLNKQYDSLTGLAYEGEYYDQAHFIRDFRAFTGKTPGDFYGRNLQLSALFYGVE